MKFAVGAEARLFQALQQGTGAGGCSVAVW